MKNIEQEIGKERLAVEIGSARPEEAREIAELLYRSWLDTYPNEQFGITTRAIKEYWKEEFSEPAVQDRAQRIEKMSPNVSLLVARVKGELVGVARVSRLEQENYLGALYVHPEYISKGLGAALWARVREVSDKTKDTTLFVAPYNERAKKFYESIGFAIEDGPLVHREELTLPGGAVLPQQKMRRPADIQSNA